LIELKPWNWNTLRKGSARGDACSLLMLQNITVKMVNFSTCNHYYNWV
jgi:hypothetical protein